MNCRNCQDGWLSSEIAPHPHDVHFPYPQVGWPLPQSPGDLQQMPHAPGRFPHKCPVCNGSGRVSTNTYADVHAELGHPIFDAIRNETLVYCRSCKGEGIVWG